MDLNHQLFSHTLLLLLLIPVVLLLRRRRLTTTNILKPITNHLRRWWFCDCDICRAYVTASWADEHPNLSDWYTHLLRRSPTKTVRVHVLGDAVFTANPDTVEYILKTRFDNYPKGKPMSEILGDFLGCGIFNVDGNPWLFQRRLASRELDSASVRYFAFGVVAEEIRRRLIPQLCWVADCNGAVLDLQEVFRRFSLDCICKFSLGINPQSIDKDLSLPNGDFASAFDTAAQLSAERALHVFPFIWKLKRALNLGSEKRLKKSLHVISSLARHVILQRRHTMTSSSPRTDLLSRFMTSPDVADDDVYLRDIIVSFILAGRDSVASALTGFFFLIATHPAVEAAIVREAEAVVGPGKDDVAPSIEQMRRLNYLQAAVYESMRLYPPVQFDSKFCLNDDVLPDGTAVTRGTRVTYHTYAMGRMEEIWGKDCLEFKPERWLKKHNHDDVVSFWFCCESPYKYPVFQAGVRICLGKEMALMQIKMVALSLLRRFRFRLASSSGSAGVVPRFSPGLTANFKGGLQMVVRRKD